MSDLNAGIRRDLTRKIEEQLEAVMRRELAIAQVALPSRDVVLMYLQIAAAFSSCAIGSAVSLAKPDHEQAAVYDDFAGALLESVGKRKSAVLAALERLARA